MKTLSLMSEIGSADLQRKVIRWLLRNQRRRGHKSDVTWGEGDHGNHVATLCLIRLCIKLETAWTPPNTKRYNAVTIIEECSTEEYFQSNDHLLRWSWVEHFLQPVEKIELTMTEMYYHILAIPNPCQRRRFHKRENAGLWRQFLFVIMELRRKFGAT